MEFAKSLVDRTKRSSSGIAAGAVPENENPPDRFSVSGNPEPRQSRALIMIEVACLRDRMDGTYNCDQQEHDIETSRAN
jgi:hypothetical protein